MTYSVWYYSNAALGSIQECECTGVDLVTARKWFDHHTTNVTAKMGWTVMVRVVDSNDCVIAEWRHGHGVTWPVEEVKVMIEWEFLHPKMTLEHLGYIPDWLSEANPKSAREQLNDGYAFGGWRPFRGFKLRHDNALLYPGDPPTIPLAQAKLRDELIVFYSHSWVAVIQPDRSFEVCRMD